MSWKWSFTVAEGAISRDTVDELRRVEYNVTQDFSISRLREEQRNKKGPPGFGAPVVGAGKTRRRETKENENMHKGNCYQPHRCEQRRFGGCEAIITKFIL